MRGRTRDATPLREQRLALGRQACQLRHRACPVCGSPLLFALSIQPAGRGPRRSRSQPSCSRRRMSSAWAFLSSAHSSTSGTTSLYERLAIRLAKRPIGEARAVKPTASNPTMLVVTQLRQALQHAGVAGAASAIRLTNGSARLVTCSNIPTECSAGRCSEQNRRAPACAWRGCKGAAWRPTRSGARTPSRTRVTLRSSTVERALNCRETLSRAYTKRRTRNSTDGPRR